MAAAYVGQTRVPLESQDADHAAARLSSQFKRRNMRSAAVNVVRADVTDADTIIAILSAGFQADPVAQWLFPGDAERERVLPLFFRPFAESALAAGEIYTTDDRAGAALWLPVDVATHGDELNLKKLYEPILGPVHAERIGAFDERSTANHPAHADHVYLPFIAVRPERHGRGIGTALLRDRLDALDEQGVPTYLEASTKESARLYSRVGYRWLDRTTDLPDGPSLYPMWRDPQPGRF
jgi:GNAT superfamily N-acetyltransferase